MHMPDDLGRLSTLSPFHSHVYGIRRFQFTLFKLISTYRTDEDVYDFMRSAQTNLNIVNRKMRQFIRTTMPYAFNHKFYLEFYILIQFA